VRRVPDVGSIEYFLRPKEAFEPLRSSSMIDELAGVLAATLALRWLAYSDPYLPAIQLTVELFPTITIHHDEVFRVPRCPSCSDLRHRSAPLPWTDAVA
jgi:hypothetical protein